MHNISFLVSQYLNWLGCIKVNELILFYCPPLVGRVTLDPELLPLLLPLLLPFDEEELLVFEDGKLLVLLLPELLSDVVGGIPSLEVIALKILPTNVCFLGVLGL
jgi:hypothetical protein